MNILTIFEDYENLTVGHIDFAHSEVVSLMICVLWWHSGSLWFDPPVQASLMASFRQSQLLPSYQSYSGAGG
jgi:hypothetical protein